MCETSGIGGGSHYTYNLCQALSNYVDVVLVTNIEYELENYRRFFSIRKVFKKEHGYFKKIYNLFRAILLEKPDILHFQSILTARKDWLFFRVLRFLRFPLILTVHNVLPHDDFERNTRGMKFSLKSIYSSCHALIVHSLWSKKELLSNFDIDEDKVYPIPHGHYLFLARNRENLTKDMAREKLSLPIESKVVLCFGTIREYKGIQHLIPAFSKVIKKIPTARLIIVGPPIESVAEQYRELIKDLHLEKFTLYRPAYIPIEDVPLYFRSADIAVFPYLHTYGSGALHLAFAFSLPVIATDIGIFSEMVEDGKNGYLVPSGDVDSLVRAMIKLLSHPEGIKRMGEHSRHLAETRYSWEMIAQKTSEIYEKTIRKSGEKAII